MILMNGKPSKQVGMRGKNWFATGGIFAGVAALIGSSCCVLPLVLVNLGVSTALVSNLSLFAKAQPYFLGLTIVLIGLGLTAAFWNGRRPSFRLLSLIGLAGIFAAGAYIMPFYERELLQWIR